MRKWLDVPECRFWWHNFQVGFHCDGVAVSVPSCHTRAELMVKLVMHSFICCQETPIFTLDYISVNLVIQDEQDFYCLRMF